MGKKTAQRDTIKDITSDNQVNSYFPYRWSPARLTFNIYFYLFLYLYITRITLDNGTPHLKSPKNQDRRAALGRSAIKVLRGFKSRKETPQKLTQLSSRSHPRHLVGKRTAQKDITIDTTSDSQVNSNFNFFAIDQPSPLVLPWFLRQLFGLNGRFLAH